MSLLPILKQNRVFVAGILLPFLLIALMAIAKNVPLADPPQYQAVFWVKGWSGHGNLSAKIKDDKHLEITYTRNKNYVPSPSYADPAPKATVYIYTPTPSPEMATLKEITVDVSATDLTKDSAVLSVPQLDALAFTGESTSPDGYNFELYNYRRHSMITDIFGGYHNNGPALIKMGRAVRIKLPTGYYNGTPEFIGWMSSSSGAQ